MTAALLVFGLSFFGIAGLFGLKHWELRHERILVPGLRRKIDVRAQQLKELAYAARADAAVFLPEIVRFGRFLIHEAVLGFAALARFSERQAHRLADMVSHKRGYERRETRSEFLKKVAEHKSAGDSTLGENGNI